MVSRARSRYTAALVALCFGVAAISAAAEQPEFVLLPDKSFVSPDPGAQGGLTRPGRDWVGLGRDTVFLLGYQTIFVGALYLMPESVSRWTDEQKKTSFEKWWDNVQHPVTWDKDNLLGNYVGHPLIGAAYYTRARERGFGAIDSFLYSALASAMFEFGPEAFFERPSIQDLIVTPVGGALLGLAFEPARKWVRSKPEPRWYGHVILIGTDPIGALNGVLERLMGIKSDIRVDVWRENEVHVELRMRWK
jgi:Domain of unknown function (DUF3943)